MKRVLQKTATLLSKLPDPLTERELEVLGMIARGLPNKQIADDLNRVARNREMAQQTRSTPSSGFTTEPARWLKHRTSASSHQTASQLRICRYLFSYWLPCPPLPRAFSLSTKFVLQTRVGLGWLATTNPVTGRSVGTRSLSTGETVDVGLRTRMKRVEGQEGPGITNRNRHRSRYQIGEGTNGHEERTQHPLPRPGR